jgi:hypothetical protein
MAALTMCAGTSLGVMLLPGATVVASAEPDPAGGTVLATTGPVPYTASNFSGTLTSTVIAGDATNPYGGLTFVYQVTNSSASINSIGRATFLDFTGWLTDVSFQTPLAGLAPALADRGAAGDFVGFTFVPAPLGPGVLMPGMSTAQLVVQTNAPAWKNSIANVIDGSVAGNILALAPAVPEPATVSLLALAGLALLRRRLA